jgi:hypothetical protein
MLCAILSAIHVEMSEEIGALSKSLAPLVYIDIYPGHCRVLIGQSCFDLFQTNMAALAEAYECVILL